VRNLRTFLLVVSLASSLAAFGAGEPTSRNDDSCDIGVTPAATLLIPYFEVDFDSPQTTAHTTLFTITNTSPQPQIARATLWTDWGYPAYAFDIFLTAEGRYSTMFDAASLANGCSKSPLVGSQIQPGVNSTP
jgi:hypothetical protein